MEQVQGPRGGVEPRHLAADAVDDEHVGVEQEVGGDLGGHGGRQHDARRLRGTLVAQGGTDAEGQRGQGDQGLGRGHQVEEDAGDADAADDARIAAAGEHDALVGHPLQQADALKHVGQDQAADHHPGHRLGPGGEGHVGRRHLEDDVQEGQQQGHHGLIQVFQGEHDNSRQGQGQEQLHLKGVNLGAGNQNQDQGQAQGDGPFQNQLGIRFLRHDRFSLLRLKSGNQGGEDPAPEPGPGAGRGQARRALSRNTMVTVPSGFFSMVWNLLLSRGLVKG